MQPYEGDEPEEYRGAPAGGRYRRAYRGGQQPPGEHQSPPPRGGPQGTPGPSSPPTREERARGQAQGPPPREPPQGAPPAGEEPGGYGSGRGQLAAPGVGAAGQPAPGVPAGEPARPPGEAAGLAPVGVEAILQTDVVTAERDTPVATVVAQMAEDDVGSVVIVEGDSPVGIVTDRRVALALESDPDVTDRRADELIAGEFVVGSTDMSVVDVLDRLSEAGIRRLPVVDDDGALAGIVTLDDVLVHSSEELERAADVVRIQSPRL